MPTIWSILGVLLTWNGALWLVLGWVLAPGLPGGWGSVAALGALLLLPVVPLARGIGGHAYPSAARRLWVYRPFWYGQLFLPVLAGAALAGGLLGLPFGAARPAGRVGVGAAAFALLVLALWGYAGTRRLVVHAVDAPFDGLPRGLDGMRIVQLSDLHVGPHTSRRHLSRIVEAVRSARPDLIALTGDQVDDYARDVEPLVGALHDLAAPLGVFAVAGNHDVYAGWEAVRQGMERAGWRVLVNDAVAVERGGARFWVAGTGDPAGRMARGEGGVAPDVSRTLARVPPGEFTLALAHNPALWPELAARGADLTLSGHTHHGQLSVPRWRWSAASVFLDLAMGEYRRVGAVLYISPGTNFWGIPFRIGALPEVTVVTLRARGP